MPLNIIVGAQWGDEGKGRMVDLLAAQSDYVARFSGGDNAGHTVTIGEKVYKLHLIPSGMFQKGTVGVMGNGMVINLDTLKKEIEFLKEDSIEVTADRLKISSAAHFITPAHLALDAAQEKARGSTKIGTTLRGIGPAYVDKTARRGLRMGDLLDTDALQIKLSLHLERANQELQHLYHQAALDPHPILDEYLAYAQFFKPFISDTSGLLAEALAKGQTVLAEGAQGTLLDLDLGTYPYVTSSHPTASGALMGLGLGPKVVQDVVGVAKAFQTRVGEGAMPTELEGELAQRLRGTGSKPWDEFGTTTGRPRRVGWLDLVLLRYTARANSFSKLALTKLDILSGFDTLKICTGYRWKGKKITGFPNGIADLADCEAIYETLPGWQEDVQNCRDWSSLPPAAQRYIEAIEAACGVPVGWISVGAERDQMVIR